MLIHLYLKYQTSPDEVIRIVGDLQAEMHSTDGHSWSAEVQCDREQVSYSYEVIKNN